MLARRKSRRVFDRLNQVINEGEEPDWHDYVACDLPVPGHLLEKVHVVEPASTVPSNVSKAAQISRKESIKDFTNNLLKQSYDHHHVFFTP